MTRVVIIRPGATDYDEQRRIKGNLDIPLNAFGTDQITRAANELAHESIDIVYSAPGQAAVESARILSQAFGVKSKTVNNLRNLDHGLWQGKLIDEVKSTQRKVYKKWQEEPEAVCPPEGEMLDKARSRVRVALEKILKKNKQGRVAIVVPEPVASLVRCILSQGDLGDLWQVENHCASWQVIDSTDANPVTPGIVG